MSNNWSFQLFFGLRSISQKRPSELCNQKINRLKMFKRSDLQKSFLRVFDSVFFDILTYFDNYTIFFESVHFLQNHYQQVQPVLAGPLVNYVFLIDAQIT